MERETKTITTPSGHTVVHYSYATGREARIIEGKYMNMVKVGMKPDGTPEFKELNTNASFEAEQELLRLLVISVNDSKENVVDTLLDMKQEDYEFVVSAVNEVTKKKS